MEEEEVSRSCGLTFWRDETGKHARGWKIMSRVWGGGGFVVFMFIKMIISRGRSQLQQHRAICGAVLKRVNRFLITWHPSFLLWERSDIKPSTFLIKLIKAKVHMRDISKIIISCFKCICTVDFTRKYSERYLLSLQLWHKCSIL